MMAYDEINNLYIHENVIIEGKQWNLMPMITNEYNVYTI